MTYLLLLNKKAMLKLFVIHNPLTSLRDLLAARWQIPTAPFASSDLSDIADWLTFFNHFIASEELQLGWNVKFKQTRSFFSVRKQTIGGSASAAPHALSLAPYAACHVGPPGPTRKAKNWANYNHTVASRATWDQQHSHCSLIQIAFVSVCLYAAENTLAGMKRKAKKTDWLKRLQDIT